MVSGKEFRENLGKNFGRPRNVKPFSMQSNQPNTVVVPPPRCFVFRERKIDPSLFRKYFLRGDIPICRAFDSKSSPKTVLMWRTNPKELDYSYYLPIFFDGLCETKLPYKSFARCGVHDMLKVGGDKILPVIPQLIIPIKKALNTRTSDVIIATLKALQQLVLSGPSIGESLVRYYRQLLPILNLFCNVNKNIGDKIDFNSTGCVGDSIKETLQILEKFGGRDSFINIKYMVPTYESCI